jgi:hypothetical protein
MMQNGMMHGCPMMSGSGGIAMMIAMGLIWILIVAALLLSIAALVKYLRSTHNR